MTVTAISTKPSRGVSTSPTSRRWRRPDSAQIGARYRARGLRREHAASLNNIAVHGGAVTVSGSHVPPGDTVAVLGMPVPLDDDHHFVARQILPGGPQQVTVNISERARRRSGVLAQSHGRDRRFVLRGPGRLHRRRRQRQRTDRPGDGRSESRAPRFRQRPAGLLLQGPGQGAVAADGRRRYPRAAGPGPVQQLLPARIRKYLLRRIDPDRYYPVYGDDSTTVQDAPTSGKFYVRLEKGDSSVLWGDFQEPPSPAPTSFNTAARFMA